MSTMLTVASDFAGKILMFVFGTVIGWVTYGIYKLGVWLVGLL